MFILQSFFVMKSHSNDASADVPVTDVVLRQSNYRSCASGQRDITVRQTLPFRFSSKIGKTRILFKNPAWRGFQGF